MHPLQKRRYLWLRLSAILILFGITVSIVASDVFGTFNLFRDIRLNIAGYKSHTTQIGNSEVYWNRGGNGKKTVLLIHGFGIGGATTWFDPMLKLKEDYDVLVPDLLWFGKSQSQLNPTLQNQASVLWALCDSLEISPYAIMGVSYGGFVAFEMLNQRPRGSKKLMILNSPGPIFGMEDLAKLCDRAGVQQPDELFVPDKKEKLKHLFNFVFSQELPVPDFVYDQIYEEETQKHAQTKRELMQELVVNIDQYKKVAFPKTQNCVIWSQNDQVFPLEYGKRLADSLHAEISILPNSGHVPHPSDKKVYLDLIYSFLSN